MDGASRHCRERVPVIVKARPESTTIRRASAQSRAR
jgi:hypothetical protein